MVGSAAHAEHSRSSTHQQPPRHELSVLQPILGLSYVLSLLAGWAWLGETITVGRVVGVIAVVIGVAMVARSSR